MRWKDLFSPITHMDTSQVESFIESRFGRHLYAVGCAPTCGIRKGTHPRQQIDPLAPAFKRSVELDPEKPVIAY
jgi:hypothetical protein